MKINKSLSEMLYILFGPYGGDYTLNLSEKMLVRAVTELERHGLVKLVVNNWGSLDVFRTLPSRWPAATK